ncbi:fungal-specific transcription factor domain-containing protein [Phaeosphaeria sp. MPI-PUGE-AT-0046c]|nr:fungal-specific transcription factor domain-containing protein [Phaeosphaeria sp. MPI-PUGE-AT-0046c]
MMPQRRDKADASAPRKRALVSCDRCKLRRARCIRDNADEPCADCRLSGVHCESKLPRKQRVYGSVETLSLRYRALEGLVKGLFPQENVHDTNVVFKLARERDIPMPAADDYTPADIFHKGGQRPLPTQPAQAPEYGQLPTQPQDQLRRAFQADPLTIRSTSTSSPGSTSKTSQHNPFLEVQPLQQQNEELIPTRNGVPHYFGPSSSFRLATTLRALEARCRSIKGTQFPKFTRPGSTLAALTARAPDLLRPSSTNPSEEEYTVPGHSESQSPKPQHRKRSTSGMDGNSPWEQAEKPSIADLLPSRSLADALTSAYFDHVHLFLPLFDRSIFQYKMIATYSRHAELIRECKDIGWLVCLAMVFAFGCEQLHEHDPDQAQLLRLKYLDFAKIYIRKLLTTTSLFNVQALMLLNMHHHTLGQKSTAWLLVGLAARMSITMGLHRNGSNSEFDPIERNTRRQVWWSVYILEKILCSVLGRPTVIDDREMTLRLPDGSMLDQQGVTAEFMDCAFELVQMSYRIRQRAYFDSNTGEERSPPLGLAVSLLREIEDFHSRLPGHLLTTTPLPLSPGQRVKNLLLHVYYYYSRCIITRDFLIQKVERGLSLMENKLPPISEDWETTYILSEDCVESAHQSIRCMMAGLDLGSIGYSWFDLFFVFHSVLIVCADFLARPQGQSDSPKDKERKDMVRAMLDRVNSLKKQAPAYGILSRIAMQFATLTGVYNPVDDPGGSLGHTVDPSPEPRTASVHDSVMSSLVETSDFEEDWFASATTNLGLDFFDLNQVQEGGAPMQPANTAYTSYLQPITQQVDDWTERTLRGSHDL